MSASACTRCMPGFSSNAINQRRGFDEATTVLILTVYSRCARLPLSCAATSPLSLTGKDAAAAVYSA